MTAEVVVVHFVCNAEEGSSRPGQDKRNPHPFSPTLTLVSSFITFSASTYILCRRLFRLCETRRRPSTWRQPLLLVFR